MLHEEDIQSLSEPARRYLEHQVETHVVVVRHPIFGGGYDVWYRDDFREFARQNEGLARACIVEPATLQSAWEYLELLDREHWSSESRPIFEVWPCDTYGEGFEFEDEE